MVVCGGLVKVLDFGMGRIVDDADSREADQHGRHRRHRPLHGSRAVPGSAVTAGRRPYALGCVLFELLTGVRAVHQRVGLRARREAPPRAGAQIGFSRVRTCREALARLIEQLLDKDPVLTARRTPCTVRDALRPACFARRAGGCPGLGADEPGDTPPCRSGDGLPGTPRDMAAKPALGRPIGAGMDVFGVHQQLIEDYRAFTEGGTIIRDDRIKAFVEEDLDAIPVAGPLAVAEPVLRVRRHRARTGPARACCTRSAPASSRRRRPRAARCATAGRSRSTATSARRSTSPSPARPTS